MFIAALFTIAPNWKKLTYLSTGELITKFWYSYTMEHNSAVKMNELLIHAKT